SKVAAALLIAMTGLVLSARVSSAEWFADFFAGVSLTQDHDLSIRDPVAGQGVYRDTEFGTAPAYGLRLGPYFERPPFLRPALASPWTTSASCRTSRPRPPTTMAACW